MDDKIEITLEGVLCIRRGGELIATVSNDLQKRVQVFSSCKDMGIDDIKSVLELLLATPKV